MSGRRPAATKGKDNPAMLRSEGESLTSRSSSFASSSDESSFKKYFQANDLPYGKSLLPAIWNSDPNSDAFKILLFGVTATGLLYLWFFPIITVSIFKLDASWEEQRGLTSSSMWALPQLISITLNISIAKVNLILFLSFAVYVLIGIADIVIGTTSSSNNGNARTHPWPAAWKTDNWVCYGEMFCEPTRWGRLIRRPGNTLSNINYLLTSMYVITSCCTTDTTTIFWMADIQFGIMLFILAVFSTLWHASNAPWTQYPDLWSMDSCIFYLMIRSASLGLLYLLTKFTTMERASAQKLAATACVSVYSIVIAFLGKTMWGWYQRGWLHGHCPFSARARLTGKGDLFGQGQKDCLISTVCAYVALPVVYTAIPTLWQVPLLPSLGSTTSATWAFRTLFIGWTYRMWERFVLDGCPFVNVFADPAAKEPTLVHTVGAAIFSPTAVLHFFTGLTLLTGYMHARSMEDSV